MSRVKSTNNPESSPQSNPQSSQGCHAEYVSASAFCISSKPKNLSHLQAASIPYVGLTAWAALTMTAGLNLDWKTNHSKQKILVFGASGGVGTFAVQLLKACNYSVSDII